MPKVESPLKLEVDLIRQKQTSQVLLSLKWTLTPDLQFAGLILHVTDMVSLMLHFCDPP